MNLVQQFLASIGWIPPIAPVPESGKLVMKDGKPAIYPGQREWAKMMHDRNPSKSEKEYNELYKRAVEDEGFTGNYYMPPATPTPTGMTVDKAVLGAKDKVKQFVETAPGGIKEAKAAEKPYTHNIQIPASQGNGQTTIPPQTAQALMEALDPIGEATNAAKVLHHPLSQTYTPEEIQRFGRESWNFGENAGFRPIADSVQADKSIDRGLMRINSNTFNGISQRHPDWLAAEGITSWDDMNDQNKSARMAKLILRDSNYSPDNPEQIRPKPSYQRWFAAPLGLRSR